MSIAQGGWWWTLC